MSTREFITKVIAPEMKIDPKDFEEHILKLENNFIEN